MSIQQDILESNYAALSSQTLSSWRIEKLFEIVVSRGGQLWYDPLSPKILALLELPRTLKITYDPSVPITTHSQSLYRTTTLWWLLLLMSGHTHPHEIPRGTVIYTPTLEGMARVVNPKKSLAGTVITI